MAGTAFNTANWTGYDAQSWPNPSGALTDFTGLIDVSILSATWKSNVQSDGADIRVTKGDDTELPYDLIDWAYNAGSPTGWIRFKWSGTLATSGTQYVRVWAGYTGGTAVAYDANETYGSDNAYDANWVAYYPDGGSIDRTSNGLDLTANGGYTAAGGTGKVGTSTVYDGTDDYGSRVDTAVLDITGALTLMAWGKHSGAARTADEGYIAKYEGATTQRSYSLAYSSTSRVVFTISTNGAFDAANVVTGATAPGTTWRHVAGTFEPSTAQRVYLDGAEDGAKTSSVAASIHSGSAPLWTGASFSTNSTNVFSGDLDELQIHSAVRSAAWIASEYAQSNNNATFWGTWAWTTAGGGGGSSIAAIANYYRRLRNR